MSLLKALGLKPTPAMLHKAALAAAAEKPTEAKDISVDKPVPVGAALARKASESDASSDPGKTVDAERVASAERDQADKLLPALAARRKALADLSKQVEDGQAKVVKLLATATPDKKKGLEEAKKKLDAALSDTHAKLEQVVADIEAIEDIFKRPVEAVGPDVDAGCGIDKLAGDAHTAAGLAHAAFQYVADAKFSPDLLHVDSPPLVGEA